MNTSAAFTRYKESLAQHFPIKDWLAVEIVNAVVIAHYLPGEPIWLRFIGASRSERTELLRPIMAHPSVEKIEVLTPSAIRGGYKDGAKIVDRVKGHLVITKELAPLLTARKEARNETFGLLRSLKDGSLTSDFGSDEGHLYQEGTFDWIIATTPVIEQQRQLEGLLGARFVDLRWNPSDREEMALKAIENNPELPAIRKDLASQMYQILQDIEGSCKTVRFGKVHRKLIKQPPQISAEDSRWIAKAADVAALCRSPVQRDSYHNLLAFPSPEIGTDLAQSFSRMAKALIVLGINDYRRYIWRLCWDSIPDIRARVLRAVIIGRKKEAEIAEEVGVSQPSIHHHLGDIKLLKINIQKIAEIGAEVK